MRKRVNRALHGIMGGCVGGFLGYSAYMCWDFHTRPGLYAAQSAPWYTGIWVYGIFVCVVLAVCLALKFLIRKAEKNQTRAGSTKDPAE